MEYIVIDYFNGNVELVTNSNGEVCVFNSLIQANKKAKDCQNGIVLPLSKYSIGTLIETLNELLDQNGGHDNELTENLKELINFKKS